MLTGEDLPTDRRGDMLGNIGDPGGNWGFLKRVGNSDTKTSSLSTSSMLHLISSLSTLFLSFIGLSSLLLCLSALMVIMLSGLLLSSQALLATVSSVMSLILSMAMSLATTSDCTVSKLLTVAVSLVTSLVLSLVVSLVVSLGVSLVVSLVASLVVSLVMLPVVSLVVSLEVSLVVLLVMSLVVSVVMSLSASLVVSLVVSMVLSLTVQPTISLMTTGVSLDVLLESTELWSMSVLNVSTPMEGASSHFFSGTLSNDWISSLAAGLSDDGFICGDSLLLGVPFGSVMICDWGLELLVLPVPLPLSVDEQATTHKSKMGKITSKHTTQHTLPHMGCMHGLHHKTVYNIT